MKMKNAPAVLLLFFTTILACQESMQVDEEMVESATSNQFVYNRWNDLSKNAPRYDGSDGGVIEKQLAMRWLGNQARHSASGLPPAHYFSKDAVAGVLREAGSNGLRLTYAITEAGERLIGCGVNIHGENLTQSNALLLSADNPSAQQILVSIDQARQLVRRYEGSAAASIIRSHYFGERIVSETISQPFCIGLKVQYATDDDGRRKLILTAVFSSERSNGRTGGTNDDEVTGDFSFPCPSTCPSSSTPGGL